MSPALADGDARERVRAARVGHLATVGSEGVPHLVPCCFVLEGSTVYSAVDAKPKTTTALRRLSDIVATGRASLLVDHYEDDWTALWWVRLEARGRIVESDEERRRALELLAAKYAQYRAMPPPGPVVALDIARWRTWSSAGPTGGGEARPADGGPAGAPPDAVTVTGDTVARTSAGEAYVTGPPSADERGQLYDLFEGVVARGEGFPQAPPLSAEDFASTWGRPTVIVARRQGRVAGAYYLRPNFAGRAGHIANAGYMVTPPARRRGVGRLLLEDSVRRAPSLGFRAIQFNLVFASNPARGLYEELGWREIGRIPDAVAGEEAVIYWRSVG